MKYNRICQILGIEKPVIQGPLSWLTDARLVAAVSNAGGLGVLGPNAGLTAETAVSLSGVNNNALSGRTNGALCRATGDTVIPGHYAAAQQQSFQCRTGDPRFCRALFFTMNASSTVKTVMTIKLTLLM